MSSNGQYNRNQTLQDTRILSTPLILSIFDENEEKQNKTSKEQEIIEDNNGKQDWKQQQLQLLIQLYKQYGPCWSFFNTKIPNKTYREIKNKFNNGIRKIAKILYAREGQYYKNAKRSINYKMLLILVNFVNELQMAIKENGFSANYQSRFFVVRSRLLDMAISKNKFTNEMQLDLIKLIKSINFRIRCFGIFKPQNSKKWKLSLQGLKTICQADPSLLNEDLSSFTKSSEKISVRKNSLQSISVSQYQVKRKFHDSDFMNIQSDICGFQDCWEHMNELEQHLFY